MNYLLLLTLVVKLASSRRIIRAAQHANKTGNFVVRVDKSVSHDDFVKIEEMIKTNSGGSLVYEAENDMIKVVTAHIKEDKLEEVNCKTNLLRLTPVSLRYRTKAHQHCMINVFLFHYR